VRKTTLLMGAALAIAGCGGDKPEAQVPAPEPTTAQETAPVAPAETAAPASSEPVKQAAAPAVPIGDAVKKYVAESAAAWSSKDVKKAAALYTEDAVLAVIGPNGWQEAKAADLEKTRAVYFGSFPDLEMTYTRVLAKGNVAVAEWVFTGTNKGDMMGNKATNKKAGFRGATVLTFTPDGKVKRESNYFDMGTMMGQLGLGPKGQPVRAAEAKPSKPTEFLIGADSDSDAAARAWLTTAEKGDAKALTALATDDVVVANQYMPADTKGKKALEKEIADGLKAFVDQKTNVVICVPAGSVVACEYTWTATWKGPAMGMKPTGKTGTVHSLEVISLKDGKVASTVSYANGTEFAASFGLMDEKPKDAPPPAKK
jgi:steroid delta-isomerase-like uncharacterized protein